MSSSRFCKIPPASWGQVRTNRRRSRTLIVKSFGPDGFTYEHDRKHVQPLLQKLGMQDAVGVTTPGTKKQQGEGGEQRERREAGGGSRFRRGPVHRGAAAAGVDEAAGFPGAHFSA